jgi:hypothetical protein
MPRSRSSISVGFHAHAEASRCVNSFRRTSADLVAALPCVMASTDWPRIGPATYRATTQADGLRREANPHVDSHFMASLQVAETAHGTLSSGDTGSNPVRTMNGTQLTRHTQAPARARHGARRIERLAATPSPPCCTAPRRPDTVGGTGTDTSSMETGSSATRSSGSSTRLAAIATRCRWSPESSCGYRPTYSSGGVSSARAPRHELPRASGIASGPSTRRVPGTGRPAPGLLLSTRLGMRDESVRTRKGETRAFSPFAASRRF